MKNAVFIYLILLPLVLMMALLPLDTVLSVLSWVALASVPLSLGLIIYAFVKTKDFYNKTKKCFIAALVLVLSALPAQADTSWATGIGSGIWGAGTYNFSKMGDAAYAVATGQYGQAFEDLGNLANPFTSAWNALKRGYNDWRTTRSLSQRDDAFRKMARLSAIPEAERTPAQQADLEKARQEYLELQKELDLLPCPTTQDLYQEYVEGCWTCDVANLFIEGADKIASAMYRVDKQHHFTLALLAIGLLFWILIRTLKLLVSFGVADIGGYFKDLFYKLMTCIFIAILLSLPMNKLVDFAISPFFIFSTAVSEHLMAISNKTSFETNAKIDEVMSQTYGSRLECKYCEDLKNGTGALPDSKISQAVNYNASADQRVVTPLMRNALLCSMCNIYQVTAVPTITGQFLYCTAKNETGDGSRLGKSKIYADWNAVTVGIFLTLSFFLVSAIFSFYLIDSFFRIAIVLILLPFLIIAFAFERTRSYTTKGFQVLVHAMMTYIIIVLFEILSLRMFYVMLGEKAQELTRLSFANDFVGLKDLVAFGKNGGHVMLVCLGFVAIVFFLLKRLDAYITQITGISLSNSGGASAAMTSTAAAVGMANDIKGSLGINPPEDVLKNKEKNENHTSKTLGTRSFEDEEKQDAKTEKAAGQSTEQAVSNAGNAVANGIDKVGSEGSKSLMKSGLNVSKAGYGLGAIAGVPMMAAGAVGYGLSKAAKFTVKTGTKALAKASGYLAKKATGAVLRVKRVSKKAVSKAKYYTGAPVRAVNKIKGKLKERKSRREARRQARQKYREK